MLRNLLPIAALVLMVYALIDCVQAGEHTRSLPRWAWIVLIVLVPVIGPILYLFVGRPSAGAARRSVPWPTTRTSGFPEHERPRPRRAAPRGPDDDPDFLASLDGGPPPPRRGGPATQRPPAGAGPEVGQPDAEGDAPSTGKPERPEPE